MLQLPAFLVAFSWTPPQLPTSAWDWGPKSASPPSSDTATIWCKYPGNGEVLFSALFHLWSQLQRHISALLKEFVDNQLAEWEGVNSTGTTGLCSQERKISWATLADFYLPPIWERGKKSVFFSLLHFFVLAWTAILFRWASSLLLQYDLESHSFSGCFAWLQALSFLVKMKFIF